MRWRIVRSVLDRHREERLKAAYRRHAVKTIVAARHVIGFRAAAFLTAGIARVPFRRFVAADGAAALVGVTVVFGLACFFTDRLMEVLVDVRRLRALAGAGGAAGWRDRARHDGAAAEPTSGG